MEPATTESLNENVLQGALYAIKESPWMGFLQGLDSQFDKGAADLRVARDLESWAKIDNGQFPDCFGPPTLKSLCEETLKSKHM